MKRSMWWSILGGIVGGAIAWVIAMQLAGDELHQPGHWHGGVGRFIGFITALGIGIGYVVVSRLTRGVAMTRDGYTLSYRPLDPIPSGYRELTTLTVSDLRDRLLAIGYAPALEACDPAGQRLGAADLTTPLAMANIALVDPGVRGWVRLQLLPSADGQVRALGLVEVWTQRGDSAAELGLFTLRALGELVGNLAAARESSRLGEDPVNLLTAGLPDRPQLRRG